MAISVLLYDVFRKKQAFGVGGVDLVTTLDVYVAIATNSYTPNRNTHDFFNDITNEVTGTNYTAGGKILDNPVVSMDGSGNAAIDFDDMATIAQHASGFSTGRYLIFYVKRGGASSADELIGYAVAAGDFGNVAGDVDLVLAAGGLITSAR